MSCPRCARANGPDRRFCGGCGASLERTCARCAFVNDTDDHFCGGCGADVGAGAARIAAATTSGVAMLSRDQLAALLAELTPRQTTALPDGAINQDDLDRLFGGAP